MSALLVAGLLGAAPARAALGPYYDVRTSWGPSNLPPGGEGQIQLQVRNVGDAFAAEDLLLEDELPAGVSATHVFMGTAEASIPGENLAATACSGIGTAVVKCEFPGGQLSDFGEPRAFPEPEPKTPKSNPKAISSGYLWQVFVDVTVEPGAAGTGTNTATISGGGAADPFTDVAQVPFGTPPPVLDVIGANYLADFFDAPYPLGEPSSQAGDHPFEQRVNTEFTQSGGLGPDGTRFTQPLGLVKTFEATLPPGMLGNPEALPKCEPVKFAEPGAEPTLTTKSTACPPDTQVGYVHLLLAPGKFNYGRSTPGTTLPNANAFSRVAIYNLQPPQGVAADLGFNVAGYVQVHIYPTLDPAQDYAIKAVLPNISAFGGIRAKGAEATLWGVPGDPAHDRYRYYDKAVHTGEFNDEGEEILKIVGAPFSAPIRPFFTLPMDCGFDNGATRVRIDSYDDPGNFSSVREYSRPLNVSGCDDPRFRFEPDVALQPTNQHAGAPTGLDVHLKVPQRDDVVSDAKELYAKNGDVQGIATPPIKKAVVTFPQGMTINPAAAQGLGSCSPEQIGLGTDSPVTCPDSSQYGTLTLHTPLLPIDEQPEGFVYIAKQNENPFHNFLSLYLVIQEPERGILVKIPGRVDLDPQTGQIITTFDDLPQFPLSDMQMTLKGGLRAGLVNPQTCGQKTIEATFYSWQDPNTPHTVTDSYETTHNPDGSPCRNSLTERPFDPDLSGGTLNPVAGSFSPLEIQMTRTDEDQELSRAEGTAPPGLTASLRGITRCTDAQIAAASNPNRTGSEEINSPSCPASSQVGSVDAGAGVGQVLTYVKGKVYLAGPYKGAPLSGVAIVPAVAGPFDLGVVVTRAPAYVNPETAQITLKTDPLPLIFKGVPVRVRDIRVHVDRPNFTLNPTSCEAMSLTGSLFSSEGKSKSSASPFQAADCGSLGFKPQISLKLKGGTRRGGHPSLRAEVRPRAGDANIASASVTLPHSAFLDQAHIRTICTRVQFAANACPAGSVYGHAAAYTPLLDEPLEGPVYLRSSSHNLPDLVVALKGPPSLPIEFNLAGRVDSVKGGIRNTFEYAPDAPVSKFVLEMQGAKKGLVVNSTDLCAKANRATARLNGHNGKAYNFKPLVKPDCGKGRKGKHSGHSKGKA
jgi:hypothetical protein